MLVIDRVIIHQYFTLYKAWRAIYLISRIDYIPTIAHNKVMIIDGKTVITGSFNFTDAAQNKHAENVIIITDAELAKKYFDNWMSRKKVSIPAQDYHR